MRRLIRAAAVTALAVVAPLTVLISPVSAAPAYDTPVEDYASYQPQKRCHHTPRPGTVALAAWIDATYDGGPALATVRACGSGGMSEHKAGRAIDWMMDASARRQRREVRAFLRTLFATDDVGNEHALARRMGVMYVIWNDRMYASYDRFDREGYLSGGCASVESCSVTLRHRDHVHISLSRAGGRGRTSWYEQH